MDVWGGGGSVRRELPVQEGETFSIIRCSLRGSESGERGGHRGSCSGETGNERHKTDSWLQTLFLYGWGESGARARRKNAQEGGVVSGFAKRGEWGGGAIEIRRRVLPGLIRYDSPLWHRTENIKEGKTREEGLSISGHKKTENRRQVRLADSRREISL